MSEHLSVRIEMVTHSTPSNVRATSQISFMVNSTKGTDLGLHTD